MLKKYLSQIINKLCSIIIGHSVIVIFDTKINIILFFLYNLIKINFSTINLRERKSQIFGLKRLSFIFPVLDPSKN